MPAKPSKPSKPKARPSQPPVLPVPPVLPAMAHPAPALPAGLYLRCFGSAKVYLDGRELVFATRRSLALLVYLALTGRCQRDLLLPVLWPDGQGRPAHLRQELLRLRTSLGQHAAQYLLAEGQHLQLTGYRADLLDFGQLVELGDFAQALHYLPKDGAADYGANHAGYGADYDAGQLSAQPAHYLAAHDPAQHLLLDLELRQEGEFEGWVGACRERLRGQIASARLGEAHRLEGRGDLAGALRLLQAASTSDPLQEHLHREIMRLYWALGQRSAALAQFARCQALLAQELQLAPMPATLALAAIIRTSDQSDQAVTPTMPASPPRPVFVGREAEQHAILAAWAKGQLVCLTGEAGIGKSRLLGQLTQASQPASLPLLQLTASEDDHLLPGATISRLLRQLASHSQRLAPWLGQALGLLLPALAQAGGQGIAEHTPTFGQQADQTAVFEQQGFEQRLFGQHWLFEGCWLVLERNYSGVPIWAR
jgi:DNA-binding SARP family transcriptional activator